MREREELMGELWSRCSTVTGVVKTARNPSAPPSVSDLNYIALHELGDRVVQKKMRGGLPVYLRELIVVLEIVIAGTSDGAATQEMSLFIRGVKQKVYAGGVNLSGKCSELEEIDASPIIRPPIGSNVIAEGLAFKIRYTEDISTQ